MREKILVTGGCGFIGASIVPVLVDSWSEVVVFDKLIYGIPETVERCSAQVVEGDIRDIEALERAASGASVVLHLAAFGSVIDSVKDPMENFAVNAQGTLNVLDVARRVGASRVVFSSTGGALIGNADPPVDERSLPRPISPYGASKLCGEAYFHAFAASYDLETVCLRFANVYGPHSAHKKGAITVFIKAIHTSDPIVIFGDGAASRDLLYVDDLCNGISAALRAELPSGCTVLHLASEVETTVLEMAHKLREIAGVPEHPIEHREARAGEVGRNFARASEAARVLGFKAEISLDVGLARTWEWFQEALA